MLACEPVSEGHGSVGHIKMDSAQARAIEILGVCSGWFLAHGFIAPVILIALGLVLTGVTEVLFPLAGIRVVATGWALKFIMIPRAAYNQGFALNHTPVRGSGLPGPVVKPGWA